MTWKLGLNTEEFVKEEGLLIDGLIKYCVSTFEKKKTKVTLFSMELFIGRRKIAISWKNSEVMNAIFVGSY